MRFFFTGNKSADLPQCDETKPECRKCKEFGVSCTYDRKAADIQMAFEGTGTMINFETVPPPKDHIANHTSLELHKAPPFQYPVVQNSTGRLQMDSLSMERLGRFFGRTALSIGTAKAGHIFQDSTLGIAFSVGVFAILISRGREHD